MGKDKSIFKEWYFMLLVGVIVVISLAARLHFI